MFGFRGRGRLRPLPERRRSQFGRSFKVDDQRYRVHLHVGGNDQPCRCLQCKAFQRTARPDAGSNQIQGLRAGEYATLDLYGGSIISSQGVSNTFGTLTINGAATMELGSGGELTFSKVSNWGTNGGLPYLVNIENASGIWNTPDSPDVSSEHIWLLTANALTADQLNQVALPGTPAGRSFITMKT